MKRFLTILLLEALLLCTTACAGGAETRETPTPNPAAANQGLPAEKTDGGRGGPGGGMPGQSSEPDEELSAILEEVQEKYELLTFTDPETGFEIFRLVIPVNFNFLNQGCDHISLFFVIYYIINAVEMYYVADHHEAIISIL